MCYVLSMTWRIQPQIKASIVKTQNVFQFLFPMKISAFCWKNICEKLDFFLCETHYGLSMCHFNKLTLENVKSQKSMDKSADYSNI